MILIDVVFVLVDETQLNNISNTLLSDTDRKRKSNQTRVKKVNPKNKAKVIARRNLRRMKRK